MTFPVVIVVVAYVLFSSDIYLKSVIEKLDKENICYFDKNMHNKHENICLLCVNL